VTSVAVVAHQRKVLGDGLPALRAALAARGVVDPIWYEVPKSKKAPKRVRQALEAGADLLFAWGGDGMVQRCAHELAGTGVPLAILPAGTANLFASNLEIPKDLEAAVEIGLHGRRRALDVGVLNGERFTVMAGTGFDARMIRDADAGLKDRLGKAAYVVTGARNLQAPLAKAKIDVDGEKWFRGEASCILLGNVGKIMGGVQAFDDARPDDGVLEIGVVTAATPLQWARVMTRMTLGRSERSPYVDVRQGKEFRIRLDRELPFELDGGARGTTSSIRAHVEPGALVVCVPEESVVAPEDR
jgi:YegS/Rv2252/BmrU family lipid kinase